MRAIIGSPLLAFVGLMALTSAFAADGLHQINKHNFGAFATYYAAATALNEHRSPYERIHARPYVYPPHFAIVCEPLAALPIASAARIMLAAVLTAIVLSLFIGARVGLCRFGFPPTAGNVLWVALVAFLISCVAVHKELRDLQSNSFVLLGFVVALHWIDRRPMAAALSLALAATIKFLPLIALPYLILRRRWGVAAMTVLGYVGIALLPAITLGWSTDLHYLSMAHVGLAHAVGMNSAGASSEVYALSNTINVSIPSTFARVVAANGLPPVAAVALSAASFLAWGVFVMRGYRRASAPWWYWPAASAQTAPPFRQLLAVEWAGLLVIATAFVPHTELALAVFPATIAAVLLLPARSSEVNVAARLGTILLAIALIFPIAPMGHRFTVIWNMTAASCWLLLLAYVAVSRAAVRSDLPRSDDRRIVTSDIECHPNISKCP